MSYVPLKTPLDGEEETRGRAELDKEEWPSRSEVPGTPRNPRTRTAIKWTAIVLFLLGFFFLGRKTADTAHHPVSGNEKQLTSLGKCPPDWKEAKEAGCVYDLVLSTWMHPRCFNTELNDRYKIILREMDFRYWLEPEMINEIALEVVETGEHGWVWTDGRFHHLHCAYVMDRIQAASKNETRVLDSLCRNDMHVGHCLQFNGNPDWEDVKGLNTTRIFNEEYLVDCLVG